MRDTIMFVIFILFFAIVGGMIGYRIGEVQTVKDINPEACVSVCAYAFEKMGC